MRQVTKKFLIKALSDQFGPETNYEKIDVITASSTDTAIEIFLTEQEGAFGRNRNLISIEDCYEV